MLNIYDKGSYSKTLFIQTSSCQVPNNDVVFNHFKLDPNSSINITSSLPYQKIVRNHCKLHIVSPYSPVHFHVMIVYFLFYRYAGHYFVTTLIYSLLLGFLGMDRWVLHIICSWHSFNNKILILFLLTFSNSKRFIYIIKSLLYVIEDHDIS